MYDEERNVEYAPLSCMNDDSIANRIKSEGATPCIYAINASQKLNSDIALDFRRVLEQRMIEFLIPYEMALEEVLSQNHEYLCAPVKETSTGHKDRFSSCSYSSWIATLLEKDLFSATEEYEYGVFIN